MWVRVRFFCRTNKINSDTVFHRAWIRSCIKICCGHPRLKISRNFVNKELIFLFFVLIRINKTSFFFNYHDFFNNFNNWYWYWLYFYQSNSDLVYSTRVESVQSGSATLAITIRSWSESPQKIPFLPLKLRETTGRWKRERVAKKNKYC